jgi:hypothetical protein
MKRFIKLTLESLNDDDDTDDTDDDTNNNNKSNKSCLSLSDSITIIFQYEGFHSKSIVFLKHKK